MTTQQTRAMKNFGYNSTGNYTGSGRQANLAAQPRPNAGTIYNVGGRRFTANSAEGRRFTAQQQTQAQSVAKNFAAAQNAAEQAQVDQAAVEDTIAENKARNNAISNIAFQNAAGGGQLGRGLFQRRQAGTKISSAIGSLAQQNAGALKAARTKTLQAKQAADLTRTNPGLGYRFALQSLNRQLS